VFAQNVEASLAGGQENAPAAAEFDAGGLFFSVLAGRIKAALQSVFGMKNTRR